jgi:hypothetical protein
MKLIEDLIMNKCLFNLLKEAQEQYNNPKKVLRPSASGNCARKLWYQYNNYKPDILKEYENYKAYNMSKKEWFNVNNSRARYMLVFELGHTVEAQLVNIMGDELYGMQDEVELKIGKHKLIGHIDGLWKDEYGKEWIVDFKSTNTRHFKYEIQKEILSYSYKCQAHCYMKALDIPRFMFVYYNKDTSHLKSIKLMYGEDIIKEIETRLDKAVAKEMPNREYDCLDKKDGWQCTYCSYFNECYRDEYTLEVENGKPKVKEAKL